MRMTASRRAFLGAVTRLLSTALLTGMTRSSRAAAAAPSLGLLSQEALGSLERQGGGRLGVAVLDGAGAELAVHRAGERFPLCSTFKVLAVAAVLARVDRGEERLERPVAFGATDLLEHAPVVRARAAEGQLSVSELCEAAIALSDNTAANLLLESLGGPARVSAFARTLGDLTTRLDRNEPSLNECLPGDERDTSTPRAMARTLHALLLGPALSNRSRALLEGWMTASTTGLQRLRAGVPASWRAADKTGSGHAGTTNDIALLRPPEGKPIIVAVFLTQTGASADVRNGVFAEIARRVTTRG